MYEKLKAALLAHGVPAEVVAMLDAIHGHAAGLALMLFTDTKDEITNFIKAEYAKVVAALQKTVPPTA